MLDAYLQAHPIILLAILIVGWTVGLWHELKR